MGRKISDIYTEYKIIPSLQRHMLQVAAVASIICDNFNEPLSKDDIITACLLHDMANIIKFKMDTMPEFFEPEGVEYWQKIKDEYVAKYESNEHEATMQILKELKVSDNVLYIVSGIDFSLIPSLSTRTIEAQISAYADCRVAPLGIMSVRDRLFEGRERYKNKPNQFSEEQWNLNEKIMFEAEEKIFRQCRIKPKDITDEIVAPMIERFKDFVIK